MANLADIDPRILRDRLSSWDSKSNPLVKLSDQQKDCIMDLTSFATQRQLPPGLPIDDMPRIISEVPDEISENYLLGDKHFPITNFQDYFSWMVSLETTAYEEKNCKTNNYIEKLRKQRDFCNYTLEEISKSINCAEEMKEKYVKVSTSTSALHSACEHLLTEQQRLSKNGDDITQILGYFKEYDKITNKLSLPYLAVNADNIIPILDKLDECVEFLRKNINFKECENYLAKYNNLLSKALFKVKTHITQILSDAVLQVMPDIHKTVPNPTDDAFTLFYGKFRTNAPRVKSFMELIEPRFLISIEYEHFICDCHAFYLQQRHQMLKPSVNMAVSELVSKHSRDHCSLMRSGCMFMLRLCEDEYQLFMHFFTKPTQILHESLENLCSIFYDIFRPFIIHVNHLETLAELCSILKIEMLEEHMSNDGQRLIAFENTCSQMLQDVQERLVFRTQSYVRSEILGYNPAPGDLAYPEKLEMMQSIALSGRKPENGHHRTSSVISTASSTSAEVAKINQEKISNRSSPTGFHPIALNDNEINGRIYIGSNMPMSPADLHGMWYPTVRRTLVCLSKLYRCVDKSTFQGLSQEALNMCIQSLTNASNMINQRKTKLDSMLFFIKHLLILREQIAPFQVDFSVKETALDFSKLKSAATDLFMAKSKLFSFNSNNAVLRFIVEGTPQVTESFVDSKKEVDLNLKKLCEEFIEYSRQLLAGPLINFLDKSERFINLSKEDKSNIKLCNQPFATPQILNDIVAETYKKIKVDKLSLQKSMTLYLANRETEVILLKPVKMSIQSKFQLLHTLLLEHYTEEDRQIIAAPSLEQVNLQMISSTINNTS